MFDREVALSELASKSFDVVVVGGGITGAGVALDAASRGLRTALVERGDFASGTSSKSSKMVHGGLRYLQQHEFALVRQSLTERRLLLQNAPHLVERLTLLVPLFGKGGVVDRATARGYSTALWMYDLAGGWRIGKRHHRITAEELTSHFPTLRTDTSRGGIRLLRRLGRRRPADACSATDRRARAWGRRGELRPVVGLVHDGASRVTGVRVAPVVDPRSGSWLTRPSQGDASPEVIEVRAKVVVNATGVWADDLHQLDDPSRPTSIRPAKGVHLTVARDKLPCDIATVLPVAEDHRAITVIPWGEHTYIGTTDTDYEGPLDDPRVEPGDISYVLSAVNAAVSSPIRPEDVTASWAGLRPLLASTATHGRSPSARTADLSRRHKVERSVLRAHHHHRGQADDLPQDGGGHSRRRMRRARIDHGHVAYEEPAPSRLCVSQHRPSPGARRQARTRRGRPGPAPAPLWRRDDGRARSRHRSARALRSPRRRSRSPRGGSRVRGPFRDGQVRRRRLVAAHPGPAARCRGPRPQRQPDRRAARGRARLGRGQGARRRAAFDALGRHDLAAATSLSGGATPGPEA